MLIESIILGIVQGLTEFLPVSSSGHMVIFKSFLEMETQGVVWEISLHLGTLLAVFGVFFKDIFEIFKSVCISCKKAVCGERLINVFKSDDFTRFFILILIGTIPTALIAFFLKDIFEEFFHNPVFTGLMLLVTGTILWLTRYSLKTKNSKKELGIIDALIVGTVQGFAITPGISRSGTTIAAATFMGVDRETAARYSFLLSIPAILGAMVMVMKDAAAIQKSELSFMITGGIIAAIVGYASLRFLIKLVAIGKLYVFSYYCWPVGIFIMLFFSL